MKPRTPRFHHHSNCAQLDAARLDRLRQMRRALGFTRLTELLSTTPTTLGKILDGMPARDDVVANVAATIDRVAP